MLTSTERLKCRNLAEALGQAFPWSDTPQGAIYWDNVKSALQDLGRESMSVEDRLNRIEVKLNLA